MIAKNTNPKRFSKTDLLERGNEILALLVSIVQTVSLGEDFYSDCPARAIEAMSKFVELQADVLEDLDFLFDRYRDVMVKLEAA